MAALFAGGGGISLLVYGFARGLPGSRPAREPEGQPEGRPEARPVATRGVRSVNDLVIGLVGIAVAGGLATGLALNGGAQFVVIGLVLLAPMVTGSAYLCVAFIRAPQRDWRLSVPGRRLP